MVFVKAVAKPLHEQNVEGTGGYDSVRAFSWAFGALNISAVPAPSKAEVSADEAFTQTLPLVCKVYEE